jgi:predicted ATPase
MQGHRFLHSIRLRNLLSYGDPGIDIGLEPLNVLIGPNASGKSNLIAAISLLAAAPVDIQTPIREGGGVGAWLWKGARPSGAAQLEVVCDVNLLAVGRRLLRYGLSFGGAQHFAITQEFLDEPQAEDRVFFRFPQPDNGGFWQPSGAGQSVLAQIQEPTDRPEITFTGRAFRRIAVFSMGHFGSSGELRRPQRADLPTDFLLEDGSNLGLILNDFDNRRAVKKELLEKLRLFYEGVEELTTKVQGGTIEIFFHERGLSAPVPAVRLSDGTLHYLCLLAILCHPEPPPLICIEEPELGLHPDILPTVAGLLREAATRTQLIVTTHSEALVAALSEVPETVLVCERDEEGTTLRRLEPAKLAEWLERYSLGDLWSMGEIGGTRW